MCQFLVLAITTGKNKVLVIRLAGCAVVSVFGPVRNRQFFSVAGKFNYDWKKKVLVVCLAVFAVVSVFGSGDYDLRKKNAL